MYHQTNIPLPFPLLPPCLASLRARAPKLMRRANGVLGLLPTGTASVSSNGFSSTEADVADVVDVDRLSLRDRNGEGCCVGDD